MIVIWTGGAILLTLLILGPLLGCFEGKLTELNHVDFVRRAAKTKHYVLHEGAYRLGREVWVPKKFANANVELLLKVPNSFDSLIV